MLRYNPAYLHDPSYANQNQALANMIWIHVQARNNAKKGCWLIHVATYSFNCKCYESDIIAAWRGGEKSKMGHMTWRLVTTSEKEDSHLYRYWMGESKIRTIIHKWMIRNVYGLHSGYVKLLWNHLLMRDCCIVVLLSVNINHSTWRSGTQKRHRTVANPSPLIFEISTHKGSGTMLSTFSPISFPFSFFTLPWLPFSNKSSNTLPLLPTLVTLRVSFYSCLRHP